MVAPAFNIEVAICFLKKKLKSRLFVHDLTSIKKIAQKKYHEQQNSKVDLNFQTNQNP